MDFSKSFHQAHSYNDFLDHYASPQQRNRWDAFHASITLTPQQQALLQGFTRRQRVLCLAGTWCGDCVEQCPAFDHFQANNPLLEIRYQDRDHDPQLQQALEICGGARVPVVVFLSEEDLFVGRYGDRTLSKYRQMLTDTTGPACPTGLASSTELTTTVVQEWLDEFERIQLILRTSPRLRKKHGD
jgi:ferredoxin